MTTITKESLTVQQIRSLRAEAAEAGDHDMAAICDLAVDGEIDADDYTVLSRRMDREIRTMSRDEAYEAVADAINSARDRG